jgi:hypothetical protein
MEERRDVSSSWVVASGTLACPVCDLPVVPGVGASPSTLVGCSWCEHIAPGHEFLTIVDDPRPARVDIVATLS